ncbi:hypothetical protein AMS68_002373 [Peltaster fructicola]|uniref:Small ribosomal subunit protein mS41 n=1 Tax=Peltaster fructicola TaxID=286661 RepID=A0A6H0XQ89_9PEZI|nr:hypothetical protein AMS68_002373 [Peltaster fructicola]
MRLGKILRSSTKVTKYCDFSQQRLELSSYALRLPSQSLPHNTIKMALKRTSLQLVPSTLRQTVCIQCRHLHKRAPQRVPALTPFVPDTETFLTLIGRKMSQHAAKIPSWQALFSLSSEQLRESGIEPPRARRYLMWWRDRYRHGIMGIGGDLKEVTNGIAELRVVQVPSKRGIDQAATLTKDAGMRKVIVNTPLSIAAPEDPANPREKLPDEIGLVPLEVVQTAEATAIAGVKIVAGDMIAGRGIEYIKGHPSVARLRVQEGLWEQRRGHKVDGGERRKAEVRAKRRAAERKAR